MTNFKVCCITTEPEQFKVEMESIFGTSNILMNKRARNESRTMIHLGFTLKENLTVNEISGLIPIYLLRHFNFSIHLT